MHEQAFTTLEYDRLRAIVSRGAQTPMGRSRLSALRPLGDLSKINRELSAVAEAVELKRRGVSWSFSEMLDPQDAIARLHIEGATLEPLLILELGRLCEQALAARALILTERENSPVLWETVE